MGKNEAVSAIWRLPEQKGRYGLSLYVSYRCDRSGISGTGIYHVKYTKFGRSIYAVGGNEQSALMMGLNVRRVKLKAYVLDGFLCGVGSILFCLNTLGGFVEQAKGFEMDAIASSVIGGTLLTGGVGNVFGTLFGVLIKATIEAFITFQGTLSSWWTRITIAALLCFFIVLQSVLAMMKKKK